MDGGGGGAIPLLLNIVGGCENDGAGAGITIDVGGS